MKSGVQAHCSYRWSLQPLLIAGIMLQASAHTFSKSKTLLLSNTVLWKEVCHRHHKFYSRKEFHVFLKIATEDLCSWIHTDTETHTSYEMQLILPLLITGINNTWSTFRKFSPIILTIFNLQWNATFLPPYLADTLEELVENKQPYIMGVFLVSFGRKL